MSEDVTHDLDLLDDWLAGKGYGEEAGLVLRALSLIHKQAREIEKLRAALKPFNWSNFPVDWEKQPDDTMFTLHISVGHLRAAAKASKETGDE